jgi:hypothetical protein
MPINEQHPHACEFLAYALDQIGSVVAIGVGHVKNITRL